MKNKNNIWVTSDLHFNDANIIKLAKRPFSDKDQMAKALIKRWNHRVKRNDLVIICGDFILTYGGKERFREIVSQLNGRLILVKENNDKAYSYSWLLDNGIAFVCERFEWLRGGKKLLFIHSKDHVKSAEKGLYDLVIHGHKHLPFVNEPQKSNTKFYNVNIEGSNFFPTAIDSILSNTFKSKILRSKSKQELKRLCR